MDAEIRRRPGDQKDCLRNNVYFGTRICKSEVIDVVDLNPSARYVPCQAQSTGLPWTRNSRTLRRF